MRVYIHLCIGVCVCFKCFEWHNVDVGALCTALLSCRVSSASSSRIGQSVKLGVGAL